jgi:peptide/nickel transport system permease protein
MEVKRRSYGGALAAQPLALGCHLILLLAVLGALFASFYPADPMKQDLMASLMPPNFPSLLGTDSLGRDLASRILLGVRISLAVSVLSVIIAGLVGTALGLAAGYLGGVFDSVVMRVVDALMALPFVVLAIAVVAAIGPGLTNVALVLGFTGWVTFAKLVRGEVLRIKEASFVEAARAIGSRPLRIVLKHILPQTLGLLLINLTLTLGQMMISEATLSFLGLGVPAPMPTLGGILADAQETFFSAWWIVLFPGLALMLIILAVNIVGDFLRDFFDSTEGASR